jgi:ribosome biogenesis GTPase
LNNTSNNKKNNVQGGSDCFPHGIFGQIIEATGGLYTAAVTEASGGVSVGALLNCRARGLFRLQGLSPCAGDRVRISPPENDQTDGEYVITEVEERVNSLIRPKLANIDLALIVVSAVEPAPNRYVLDKLTAIMQGRNIPAAILFTKIDLGNVSGLADTYAAAGYETFCVDNRSGAGTEQVAERMRGRFTALIGNSGVGKSSLLGNLIPGLDPATAEISKKLGRGRHTTRTARIFPLPGGGFAADTPGFSTVDISRYLGRVKPSELSGMFFEFSAYSNKCGFPDCSHVKETDCAVKLQVGKTIPQSRYDSYVRMYDELQRQGETYD